MLPDHAANVCCISYDQSEVDKLLFGGCENGMVYIWDTVKTQNKIFTGHRDKIT